MTRDDALALLGIPASRILSDGGLVARTVKTYFSRRAKEVHPDTGSATCVSIRDLQTARDVLLESVARQNNACKQCSGLGKVRGAIGWRECSACNGKGETR